MKKIVFILSAFIFATQLSFAQEYPTKPIKIVIPFPPGGGADVLMRPLSKRLSELLGYSCAKESCVAKIKALRMNTIFFMNFLYWSI